MGDASESPWSGQPTGEEQLIYFVNMVGVERLGDAFALMSDEEVRAVRRVAAKPLRPSRVAAVRTAVVRRIHAVARSPIERRPMELSMRDRWIV